jgi:transposase
MNEITTVGLDLAKRVVSLCGEDGCGRIVIQRTLRREAVLDWFAQRPSCLVGMEACSSAHWFARELAALGHTPRIIAPEFVRPFRLSGKNDANDAAAICAAVRQPQLRFVAVKSAEQQARLVVHRLRQGWQEERTAAINRLRGLLAEFGRVFDNSAAAALAGGRAALADETLPAALGRAWRGNSRIYENSRRTSPNATGRSPSRLVTIRAQYASHACAVSAFSPPAPSRPPSSTPANSVAGGSSRPGSD